MNHGREWQNGIFTDALTGSFGREGRFCMKKTIYE